MSCPSRHEALVGPCPTPSVTIFSGMAREVPLADVLQEPLGRLLHEVQHPLEAVGAAVARVRYFTFGRIAGEVEERLTTAFPRQKEETIW